MKHRAASDLSAACVISFVKTKKKNRLPVPGMMVRVALVGRPVYTSLWSVKLHCSIFVVTTF